MSGHDPRLSGFGIAELGEATARRGGKISDNPMTSGTRAWTAWRAAFMRATVLMLVERCHRDERLMRFSAAELGAAAARRGEPLDENPMPPEEALWKAWNGGHRDASGRADMARPALFWLSFADPHMPKSHQFLGAAVVEALSYVEAVAKLTRLGHNPGGEIMGYEIPEAYPFLTDKVRDRLLGWGEATALNAMLGAAAEAPDAR